MFKVLVEMFKNFILGLSCKPWMLKPAMYFNLSNNVARIRVLQRKHGGKIINVVFYPRYGNLPKDRKLQYFFLEVKPGLVFDDKETIVYTQKGSIFINQVIPLLPSNDYGVYKVVRIKDTWEEFYINSYEDLNENANHFYKEISESVRSFNKIKQVGLEYQNR